MPENKLSDPIALTKRVFVLGSGFSASFGLPTLHGLFDGLMARPERDGELDKENVHNALDHLYPHFAISSPPFVYPPYEEFLSLIVAAEDFPFYPDGFWHQKRKSALRLLTDYLAEESATAESSPLLQDFVSKLQDGDVVITFNWDNLIERTLIRQGKIVNFNTRDPNAVAVLKLHGSLNWALIPEGLSLVHPESVRWLSREEGVCCMPDLSYYDLWDALDEPPFIILPISAKNPPAAPFLKNVWHQAFNSLVEAASVSVIGYSAPPDDLQARTLLTTTLSQRNASGSRYTLVDPDTAVASRYFATICPAVDFLQRRFDEEILAGLFGNTVERDS